MPVPPTDGRNKKTLENHKPHELPSSYNSTLVTRDRHEPKKTGRECHPSTEQHDHELINEHSFQCTDNQLLKVKQLPESFRRSRLTTLQTVNSASPKLEHHLHKVDNSIQDPAKKGKKNPLHTLMDQREEIQDS